MSKVRDIQTKVKGHVAVANLKDKGKGRKPKIFLQLEHKLMDLVHSSFRLMFKSFEN